MSPKIGDMVFPGDVITNLKSLKNMTYLGPGLRRTEDANSIMSTCAGILCLKPPNFYWVESNQKRYIPKKGDLIVGVVTKKGSEAAKVDIGSSELASLSMYAFECATKKQKPDLQIGDVVYAKLLSAHREMEPELVCIDKYCKAGNLGQLSSDGFLKNVSLKLAHQLLDVENPLLRTLGKKFPFEIAIGMNGKVWINAKKAKDVLNLMNALLAAEHQSDKQIIQLCRQY